MFIREREVKGRTDVNYYTARRLGDMAESLNQLARAFDDGIEEKRTADKGRWTGRHAGQRCPGVRQLQQV